MKTEEEEESHRSQRREDDANARDLFAHFVQRRHKKDSQTHMWPSQEDDASAAEGHYSEQRGVEVHPIYCAVSFSRRRV